MFVLKAVLSVSFALFLAGCAGQADKPVTGNQPQNSNNETGAQTKTLEINSDSTEKIDSRRENLLRQAEDMNRAFTAGDFEKLVDLTHPKLVEQAGGREKMLASIKSEMEKIKAAGFDFVSMSILAPKDLIKADADLFAVVPSILTVNTPKGKVVQNGSLVGISADNGENWKFVNGVDNERFKALFPNAAGKVILPEEKPPEAVQEK